MNPKDKMGAKKPNLSVLPFAPLLEVVPALYEGRRKYGPWNWRAEKVSETIYADAAIRHLMQFIAGEDIDPESGVHHIAKAIAGLLVVRDAQLHGCSIDDRMVNQNLNIAGIMGQLAGVNERYPDPVDSELPPRDGGITGGATMTEEDAEKVAEYLGLREAASERVNLTNVDDFDIDSISEGDRVIFSSGAEGIVMEVDVESGDDLPLCVAVIGKPAVTYWYHCNGDANRDDQYVEDQHKKIVTIVGNWLTQTTARFELKQPPVSGFEVNTDGSITRWSTTVAGGGSYIIKPTDIDKSVQLRCGDRAVITKHDTTYPEPYEFIVEYIDEYGDVLEECYRKDGAEYDDEFPRSSDIVKVFHS